MSKYEVNVWEYADEFKNLDTNETFYGYQVCELLEQKDQRIAELEAKLAESENQCRECKHLNKKIELNIKNKLMAENCELQKQLAENEKEISEYVKIVDDLHKQLSDKCDFCDKTKDQDKISFAVSELEKVKETTECVLDNALKNSSLNESYYDRLLDEIDNQINELKEMK